MQKRTIAAIIIMTLMAFVPWEYAYMGCVAVGFIFLIIQRFEGDITFFESGIHPATFSVVTDRAVPWGIFFMPSVIFVAEILLGDRLFDAYESTIIDILSKNFLFDGTVTLWLWIFFLVAIQEIVWRCYYQLNIGRNGSGIIALVLPALCMSMSCSGIPSTGLLLYIFAFGFLRRLFGGILYRETGCIWLVVLSSFLATVIGHVLVVGL